MSSTNELLAKLYSDDELPHHLRTILKRVFVGTQQHVRREIEGEWEQHHDLDRQRTKKEIAAEAKAAATVSRELGKKERSATKRAFNKKLRAAAIDPIHFMRLVRAHHFMNQKEFTALMSSYAGTPVADRNEFSKKTHERGGS